MVKSIAVKNHTVKLGRRRPIAHCPRLKLKHYIKDIMLPTQTNYAAKAAPALRQMYLNNSLGDCVIAGMAHLEGLFAANAGTALPTFTDQQIIDLYGKVGGYNPKDPNTDQGCDEQTALNYWQHNGIGEGSPITGWLSIDASNITEVKTAILLFENVFFGIELPDAWVNPVPSHSGFTWDVAGDAVPDNGHCFVGVDYDNKGVKIDTWGMLGHITYKAVAKYATGHLGGELYTVLSPDMIDKATKKAPNGIDWDSLNTDFKALH